MSGFTGWPRSYLIVFKHASAVTAGVYLPCQSSDLGVNLFGKTGDNADGNWGTRLQHWGAIRTLPGQVFEVMYFKK